MHENNKYNEGCCGGWKVRRKPVISSDCCVNKWQLPDETSSAKLLLDRHGSRSSLPSEERDSSFAGPILVCWQ